MKIKQLFAAVSLTAAAIAVNDLGHVVASRPPSSDGTPARGTSETMRVGRPVVLAASIDAILIGGAETTATSTSAETTAPRADRCDGCKPGRGADRRIQRRHRHRRQGDGPDPASALPSGRRHYLRFTLRSEGDSPIIIEY